MEPSTKTISKFTLKDVNVLIEDPLKYIDRNDTSETSSKICLVAEILNISVNIIQNIKLDLNS